MSNSTMSGIVSELENAVVEYTSSKKQREAAAVDLAACEMEVDEILARLRKQILKPNHELTFGSDL